jgi:outer membrane protein assembly factor BamB
MLNGPMPRFVRASALLVCLLAGAVFAAAQTAIPTYHYDNYRTGWNQTETVLTPANVNSKTFGMLQTVALDGQVDGQPLVVPGVLITAGKYPGVHDVVYVASENNTVYAIDAESGTVLLNPNFGPPVAPPIVCGPTPNLGIHSTPTIDLAGSTMYVLTYTSGTSGPAYTIHALDLGSLTDKVAPVPVTASHTLTDGTTLAFNPLYQRQRPALLLANGNVYAAFGSFCDTQGNVSRGWILGWNAATLAAMPTNALVDTQATAPGSFFLSSIWMSGYGPASDDAGNVLFVTGNSQYSSYDGVTDIQESVIKMSSDLSTVLDLFTPDDEDSLDLTDQEFGSGGVMVLPDQPGATPHLAVAAGKDGNMFLMNEDHLGGYAPNRNNVLGTYAINPCWCGESYFVDPDGSARVVSSGGRAVKVWKLRTSPKPGLSLFISSVAMGGGQYPGFFTSISSNGKASPIIWAVSRPPSGANPVVTLFAFNPDSGGTTMKQLFRAPAGTWPNPANDANIVPVVANGRVYVASSGQLQIFGLKATKNKSSARR